MSFSPLPDLLARKLQQLAMADSPVVYDLGCGDGSLGQVLDQYGITAVGLDRMLPGLALATNVVGDALEPPFLPGQADLVIAGNFFRHLVVGDPEARFLSTWQGLLRAGGWLCLLEDEPSVWPAPQRNYGAVQEFLMALSPQSRGPLLSLAHFRKQYASAFGGDVWQMGLKVNDMMVDPETVIGMLSGGGNQPLGKAAHLIKEIQAHGIEYGEYWWACWERD